MKARHKGNQKLLEAIEHVLEHGPEDSGLRSCANIQKALDRLNVVDKGFSFQAYLACTSYCFHLGVEPGYPVEDRMVAMGYEWTTFSLTGFWGGTTGEFRRNYILELREYVRDLDRAIPLM